MEEGNTITDSVVETKKCLTAKVRFAIYYIAFCAGVFTFWQIIGGISVEYSKYGYALGHSESYIWWTWFVLLLWIIVSIIFGVKMLLTDE